MSWVRLDDGYFRHPKIRAIGRDGRALHLASMCWSAANLTDGIIRRSDLPLLLAEADVKKTAVAVLVAEGAWIERPDGWEIKNFLTYNRAAEEIEAERAEARERMRRARENKKGSSGNVRPNIEGSSRNPDPTRPDPTPPDVTNPVPPPQVCTSPSTGGGPFLDTLNAALDLLVDVEQANETAPIRSVTAWRKGVRSRIAADPANGIADAIRAEHDQGNDADPVAIASRYADPVHVRIAARNRGLL